MPPQTPDRQHGFALLEALIAALVLSIGLLGMAALQSSALRNNQSSLDRSQAVILSYSILESMRSNLTVARAGGYDIGNTCLPPTAGSSVVSNDLHTWITQIQASLNDTAACGSIACVASPAPDPTRVCTITVTWNDSRGGLSQVVNTEDAARTITTVGRL